MKKDIKINNFLCDVVNNIKPTENTGLTNCETHNGADGIDGLSSGDTGWAKACYYSQCEDLPGVDGVFGLTVNDTSWAKACYNVNFK